MSVHFQRRRPGPGTARWVEAQFGPDARVVAWRRLTGGLASAVHRLTINTAGQPRFVVLRQYPNAESASLVTREAFTLDRLTSTGIPAPELIASDPGGAACGYPSLLMTRIPGHIHLAPRDRDRWLGQMAAALAEIHRLTIPAPEFERWVQPERARAPADASNFALWGHVFTLLQETPPATPVGFVHRDFQHFNLLWSGEQLTGVVDWTFAARAPREVDVGHCRLNLAALFDVDWADGFRLAYEAETGHRIDPWWDLHALATYSDSLKTGIPMQVAGRRPVDVAGMTGRIEHLIGLVLDRF